MEKYDITDYLKDDKELQKAVIEEFLKELAELGKIIDSKNGTIATLAKTRDDLKAKNERLKFKYIHNLALLSRANKTLQEIKKYLNGHKIADECRIKCILDLITKAGEE